MLGQLMEITVTLVMAYLILSNAQGFSTVAQSFSQAYSGMVQTLQGRGGQAGA